MFRVLSTLITLSAFFMSLHAYAQDVQGEASKDKEGHIYSPEHCEFSITFPSEPYTTRRCEDEMNKKRCYEQVSFTKVHKFASTANFRVICNPIDKAVYDDYSAEVMEATLRAMTKRSVVDTFNTSFREEDNYKQAHLVGEGKSGRLSTVYLAQLWIGQSSAFSVEAELIGDPSDMIDELFRDVLQSVHYKGDAPNNGDGKGGATETIPQAAQDSGESPLPQ